MTLVDTDVFIWYLRGNSKAGKLINSLKDIAISDIVYMELLQGVRNKQEMQALKLFIKDRKFECLPVTAEISNRAIYFLELFVLSHGLRLADALIAATSDIYGKTLLTANNNHYSMIPSIKMKVFRP